MPDALVRCPLRRFACSQPGRGTGACSHRVAAKSCLRRILFKTSLTIPGVVARSRGRWLAASIAALIRATGMSRSGTHPHLSRRERSARRPCRPCGPRSVLSPVERHRTGSTGRDDCARDIGGRSGAVGVRAGIAGGITDVRGLKASWTRHRCTTSLQQARALLQRLDALDEEQASLTALGREMSRLPVHPRLAHMLLLSRTLDAVQTAAQLAALLSERDQLGRRSRVRRWPRSGYSHAAWTLHLVV